MKGLLLSVIVENIATRKDRTVKVTLGTQELSQGQAGELFQLMNGLCAVYLSPKEGIDQKEVDQCDALEPELIVKSPSQRMRNVFFLLWKQNNEGFKEFDSFYKFKMEAIITKLKEKILP